MTAVRLELHERFATIAVTGTNGKTTTTSMVEAIVRAHGEPHARVTTLGSWVNDQRLSSEASLEAFALAIERGAEAGVRTLALETTSRALAEGFAQHWPAQVAVFTNLTRDHLDYHGDPEHYLAAKAQLFMTLPADGAAVFNACDPASALLDEVTPSTVRRLWYARSTSELVAGREPELAAAAIEVGRDQTRARLAPGPLADALGGELRLRVCGRVHVDNALAAALAAHALGYPPEAIRRGLAQFAGAPGRMQRVWDDPLVFVDYAHTPDALERTLALGRELAGDARLVVVFGCGGGSDPGKRHEMGRVAAELSDVVVVTSDNPRNEDPDSIIEAVMEGAREGSASPARRPESRKIILVGERDRKAAIVQAIGVARRGRGDIVVLAGKGHESTQWMGEIATPFDDAEVARAACRDRFESEDG
jgi:UDP-N-acetylmuramoyl-L-alanyl-D-glutamate--2,6-diaminopimelate ligase